MSQSFVRDVLPEEIDKRGRREGREKVKQDGDHRQNFPEGSFSPKSHRCSLSEANTH